MKIWENRNIKDLDGEIWKNIEGYNGDYQISNYGRVKSFKKWCGTDVRILKLKIGKWGYLQTRLSKNRKPKDICTYILLFETFKNYKLKKNECIHHMNENKLYNNLDNFQLMTNFDHNSLHHSGENHPFYGKHHSEETKKLMSENHTDVSGENHPFYGRKHSEETKKLMSENHLNNILTEQNIIKIRELLDEGILTQKEIAEMFGVHQSTVSKIKTGRSWKHIRRMK